MPLANAVQNSAAAPSRQSEVQQQVERSARVVDNMDKKFAMLSNRLDSVLRSMPTLQEGRKEAPVPKPVLVGHATALSNHNDQLERFDEILSDILDRLEL